MFNLVFITSSSNAFARCSLGDTERTQAVICSFTPLKRWDQKHNIEERGGLRLLMLTKYPCVPWYFLAFIHRDVCAGAGVIWRGPHQWDISGNEVSLLVWTGQVYHLHVHSLPGLCSWNKGASSNMAVFSWMWPRSLCRHWKRSSPPSLYQTIMWRRTHLCFGQPLSSAFICYHSINYHESYLMPK